MGDKKPDKVLFIADDCPTVPEDYQTAKSWSGRVLCIGAPWPTKDFFKHRSDSVLTGDKNEKESQSEA